MVRTLYDHEPISFLTEMGANPHDQRMVSHRATRLAFLLIAGAWVGSAAEPTAPALETVPSLDLRRYQGRWYEIARKPNRFQAACAGDVIVQYGLREDGRVDVFNQCSEADGDLRSASGVARIPEPAQHPARLEVRFAPAFLGFLPMVWGDYWVIDLDADYRWAVVGEPERAYFWVLSRTPSLSEETLQGILGRARDQGYDLVDLLRTKHAAP